MSGNLPPSRPLCDCCGAQEGLARVGLHAPDGSRCWGELCPDCLADQDEEQWAIASPF